MPRNPEHAAMRKLLQEMQAHPAGWAFLQPVGPEVEGYYDTITNPMGASHLSSSL
jgi:histone acetyltransferase